jgi:hypothetical protein
MLLKAADGGRSGADQATPATRMRRPGCEVGPKVPTGSRFTCQQRCKRRPRTSFGTRNAALDNRAVLASRDARAEITYRRLGAEVEMVA